MSNLPFSFCRHKNSRPNGASNVINLWTGIRWSDFVFSPRYDNIISDSFSSSEEIISWLLCRNWFNFMANELQNNIPHTSDHDIFSSFYQHKIELQFRNFIGIAATWFKLESRMFLCLFFFFFFFAKFIFTINRCENGESNLHFDCWRWIPEMGSQWKLKRISFLLMFRVTINWQTSV